jgi:hypothetical protein
MWLHAEPVRNVLERQGSVEQLRVRVASQKSESGGEGEDIVRSSVDPIFQFVEESRAEGGPSGARVRL